MRLELNHQESINELEKIETQIFSIKKEIEKLSEKKLSFVNSSFLEKIKNYLLDSIEQIEIELYFLNKFNGEKKQ